jgi:hypothetical protein
VAQEWAEDPHPTGEVRGATSPEEKAAPAEKVAPAESASSILSRLLGHNAAIPWRSRR